MHVIAAGAELYVECVVKIDFDFSVFLKEPLNAVVTSSTKDLFLIRIDNKFVDSHTT